MSEWISVDEQLPHGDAKNGSEISVVTDGKRIWSTTVHSAWWNRGINDPVEAEGITHWLSLPDPPEDNNE